MPCGDLLQGDSVTGIRLAGRFRAGRMRGADKGGYAGSANDVRIAIFHSPCMLYFYFHALGIIMKCIFMMKYQLIGISLCRKNSLVCKN